MAALPGFRYPRVGQTGAVASGNLVTACGTYNVPASGSCTIAGKVYPAGAMPPLWPPPLPPNDASEGTPDPTLGTWCLSALGGGALVVGEDYVLVVWVKCTDSGQTTVYECPFTACEAGVDGCDPDCPDCPGGRVPPLEREMVTVFNTAPTVLEVTPAVAVFELLDAFGMPKLERRRVTVQLKYDEAISTFERAVWLSRKQDGNQLRLEVTRGPCTLRAFMARVRVQKNSIEILERWGATCFDIVKGGELCGLSTSGERRNSGVMVRPPEQERTDRAGPRRRPTP